MQPNDRLLLFNAFPFDFDWTPPVDLGLGLRCVHLNPLHAERWPGEPDDRYCRRDASTISSLLFGAGLNIGQVAIGLHQTAQAHAINGEDAFFVFLAALRLWKPLTFDVGGSCRVAADGASVADPLYGYSQRTPALGPPAHVQEGWPHRYSVRDLKIASAIAHRLSSLALPAERRLMAAWVTFAQASLGSIRAANAMVVALFGCLEVLLTPGTPDARALGRRVQRLIAGRHAVVASDAWIATKFDQLRNAFAHGVHDAVPSTALRPELAQDLRVLHEVVRLVILELLCLPPGARRQLLMLKGRGTRQLDTLTPSGSALLGPKSFYFNA